MLSKDFLSGHYQKTIAHSFEQDNEVLPSEMPALIGALCFSGRLLEARRLYKDSFQEMNDSEKSACRFFLGLSYTRKSQYPKASKVFNQNLKSLHRDSTPLQRFYVYQGIAFYLFFLGKLELSTKWALKSFDSAMKSRDLYARSLSTDLLAHLKLRLGEINVGLDLLKTAEKIARQMGNVSVTDAIAIAELQYKAQYGYERDTIVETLVEKFNHITTEDNYSRAAVGLELARQHTLRGRINLSEKVLENISSNIFATENRRQEIQLNLRFAENAYQLGKNSLAWNYLRSARRCLNFEADKSFELQILGFEYKLFDSLNAGSVRQQLISKTINFNSVINHNILTRNQVSENAFFSREDLFHEFLVSLSDDSDKITKIIDSGYFSLLRDVVEVKRGESLLFYNQESNLVILFFEDRIEVVSEKLTPTDTKLLLAILNGIHDKSEICKQVWGYEYDSLRHDTVIYTAIASLRKNLGNGSKWIETSEKGYYFSADRKFKINLNQYHNDSSKNEIKAGDLFSTLQSYSSQLNLRQIKALKLLAKTESLDVLSYRDLFSVSDVTASRDLRSLKKMGFVISIGNARATKYVLGASAKKVDEGR